MFTKKLTNILSSYDKLETQLCVFTDENEKVIEKRRQELEVAEREQARAHRVLDKVQAFLND
jgi:hypothetical protein|tara:strand:+ start:11469 stop:11654 length:186 start_codon:yes stop_codon:yes gene_type:complete